MPKKTAVATAPASGPAAPACGNSACGKVLAPPLLQCSKCKAAAYCCKACQVGDPAARATRRASQCAHLRLLTHPRLLPVPPVCNPPPPDRRVEGRAQAPVRRAGAGRGGGAAPARRAGGGRARRGRARRGRARAGGADRAAEAPGDEVDRDTKGG